MEQVDIKQFEEESINIDELKSELKDKIPAPLQKSMNQYNNIITTINEYEQNLVELTPYQLAICKHYYNKAEREAWKIAGYYKSQYQFYNGRAATERGKFYIHDRDKNGYNVNDSNYRSKIHEGINQEIAGLYEGYYVTWKGIAISHQGMQTVYRDMINAISIEN